MLMKSLLIIGFVAVASAELAKWNTTIFDEVKPQSRIVDGLLAAPGDVPWHVHIDVQLPNGDIVFCA